MIEKLLLKLFKHIDIEKTVDGEKVLYLRRWFIFSRLWGGIYLHKIVRPDDDDLPHDHPWSFVTFVLKGGYRDESWVKLTPLSIRLSLVEKYCYPWNFYFRRAEHVHRVRLHVAKGRPIPSWDDRYIPAWTLVFRGPVRRKWGFVKRNGTHVYWREYLNYWGPDINEGGAST